MRNIKKAIGAACGSIGGAALFMLVPLIGMSPAAAEYPERPIRIIVGYGAGGGTDIITRTVAQPLSEILGQPVVIENKPGAGGTIGADAAAKADPDGYTMFMMNNGHAVATVINKSLPYDGVADFQPVSLIATMPLAIVARPDFEANDVGKLIEMAKADPGGMNFASVGVGSSQHFAAALLLQAAGVDIAHVPYKKTPEIVAALMSGEIQLAVQVVAPILGQIQSGDLKALAVTSKDRYVGLPDVPSVSESGLPNYDVATWYGLAFPKGTPPDIVEKMNAAIQQAVARDGVREQALQSAYLIQGSTADGLTEHLKSEVDKWRKVMAEAGIPQR